MLRKYSNSFVLFLAFFSTWLSTTSFDEKSDRAIEVLSQYAGEDFDLLSMQMDKFLDFETDPPLLDREIWNGLSPLKRIEVAFVSANQVSEENGEKFLALLSKSLAQEYESIREDATVSEYLALTNSDFSEVKFARGLSEQALLSSEVSPKVRAAIETMAGYFSNDGPLSPTSSTIEKYFEPFLNGRAPYEILSKGGTPANSIKLAFELVPESKIEEVVTKVVTDVAKEFESARYEDAFKPFLAGGPDIDPDPLGPAPVKPDRPQPPNRPGDISNTASGKFADEMESKYPDKSSQSFEDMGTRVKVFGGGVLGAKISTTFGSSKPTKVTFVSGQGVKTGRVRVDFENGKSAFLSGVFREDYAVCQELIKTQVSDIEEFVADSRGIGLIGLRHQPISYAKDGSAAKYYANVILNPALEDTELGHSVVMVDALPSFAPKTLLSKVKSVCSKNEFVFVNEFFQTHKALIQDNSYVFVDLPTEILMEGDNLRIVSQGHDKNSAKRLEDNVFIELRIVTKNDEEVAPKERYHHKFAKQFRSIVPALSRSSYDFHRFNRFSRTFAFLRGVMSAGGKFQDEVKIEKSHVPTPDALEVSIDSQEIHPTNPLSETEAADRMIKSLSSNLDKKVVELVDKFFQMSQEGKLPDFEESERETLRNEIKNSAIVSSFFVVRFGQVLKEMEDSEDATSEENIYVMRVFAQHLFGEDE